ncbi:MAG: tripartite tricarboxylate transporter TctB family protein [Thauera sp.]|jgi:putative tricarboxylic transport membrane protein|nr:tripartite tricarboxylate transporter TctB family protein [Thauera sp.]MBV2263908.1 tripartite tricarboxylate transporter TctB family protein [Thauera sp.]
MDPAKKKEVVIGAAMLATGLIYLFLTANLPRKAFIDAAFVPYLLAAGMCILGVLQLLAAWGQAPREDAAAAEAGPDYLTVGKTLGLIVGYIAVLQWLGFPIATVAYLYLQFLVLTPHDHRVSHGRYLLIALCASVFIYVVFRHGFDLLLPAGLLDFIE